MPGPSCRPRCSTRPVDPRDRQALRRAQGFGFCRAGGLSSAPLPGSIGTAGSPRTSRRIFLPSGWSGTSLKEDGNYRVAKSLREMFLFSTHDLVKDPPFSRLDLVSCRNLLIYFDPPLQQRVLATFHYALRPSRHLFLGPSVGVLA